MKLSRQLSLVFILAVVLLAGSCSRKFEGKEILSTIPAESSFVVRVDAKVLLENAGCTRNSDGWYAGQGLDALLKQSTNATRKKIEYLLKLVPVVDKQTFYVFRYNKTTIATCSLLHTEAVTDALKKEFGRPDRVSGFDVYDESIVVRGNQMWMPASVKSVEEALEAAKK
ncbi:MAG: hypothetical protein K2M12_06335 [Muribaculaceae bacterium]|nr:hypothetical protein [Muribaculaceae bacterium]